MAEVDDEKLDEKGHRRQKEQAPMPEPRSQSARACLRRALCPSSMDTVSPCFFTGRKHAGENLAMSWPDARSNWAPPFKCATPSPQIPHLRCVPSWPIAFLMRVAATWMSSPTFPRSAVFVLETLREVYHNDQLARQRGLSAEDRLAFHQAESAPHMKSLEDWM